MTVRDNSAAWKHNSKSDHWATDGIMYLRRGKDFLLHLFNGHSLANQFWNKWNLNLFWPPSLWQSAISSEDIKAWQWMWSLSHQPHISDVGTTFLILVVAHWQVNLDLLYTNPVRWLRCTGGRSLQWSLGKQISIQNSLNSLTNLARDISRTCLSWFLCKVKTINSYNFKQNRRGATI